MLDPYVTVVLKSKQLKTFSKNFTNEGHNLHDDLSLIDPPVISFSEEYQLNALLYGSDEFN